MRIEDLEIADLGAMEWFSVTCGFGFVLVLVLLVLHQVITERIKLKRELENSISKDKVRSLIAAIENNTGYEPSASVYEKQLDEVKQLVGAE